MENFIFSANVTIPIFLVMVVGYVLRRGGMLDDHFVKVANRFNFSVTLPVLLLLLRPLPELHSARCPLPAPQLQAPQSFLRSRQA